MKNFLLPVPVIGICWSLFHLYTAAFGQFPAMVQRAVHIGFALALAFLIFRITKDESRKWLRSLDYLCAVLSVSIGGYVVLHAERLSSRVWFVDDITGSDLFFGTILILLILEASRRTVGRAMTLLAVIFLAYGFLGDKLPGLLAHRGLSLEHLVDLQFLSPQGIFGVPLGVSADYVFYFVLFGAFLEISGGGKLFNDLAFWLTGRFVGGPAKAAILSGGLMGSISGSAVANVVASGIFTIPLMIKNGFSPRFAAAVEAVSSTGGQLMPPIMGAAAFVMAETLGMPYATIMLAAIIPSFLFYAQNLFMVHLQAKKDGLKRLSEEDLPNIKQEVKARIHLLIPLIILVYYVMSGYSLMTAAFYSIVATVVLSFLRKATRLKLSDILAALEDGAKQSLQVAIPCAVAGIIIGVIVFSGLGLKFTELIISLSFGNVILALILVALGTIILGMGLPTTSAYIMGAVLMAPALEQFGIVALASHMFVFYFAILSMITPPVALAAYSAAGIAGSDLSKTGWTSMFLAASSFLIPFAFVMNPAILLIGSSTDMILVPVFTLLGIFALSAAVIGYVYADTTMTVRVGLFIASILLIIPEIITSVAGAGLLIAILFHQRQRAKEGSIDSVSPEVGGRP
ncbi:TRAP transporter permease [Brevibacillus agri]|uniref:TRAP transporter permease n=1 Tax=Brevibacillus agri TaxID=51101 RepID=UPI002E230CDE|nr:TRAP transporter permease [Brevibacillus agri]MED1657221.1 TRAP transporter permease [Brevibacillus agri]MED1689614.1 TRAP transporter permease [Brevibacillus agri]MED1693900.1 TRAP transporter permease [Brevibacillus agri]MED1698276.1 TRAP transporter permease [Brevibacillus agri]